MYSLNVPVPGEIAALAWDRRSALTGFDRLRDELTLVVKRFDARSAGEFAASERAVREELTGTSPFEAAVVGIDTFEDPPAGPAPVLYLDVDSPGLVALHRQLVDRFGAAGPIEGDGYEPHITLARGVQDPEVLDRALEMELEAYRWTVDRLIFWDARREVAAGEVALPA